MEETNDKKWCVYMHTNKSNNKVYVGITSLKPQERWHANGSGYKKNNYFWRSIKKYGWDGFEHIIFADNLTKEEACNMEVGLIALYKTNNPLYGYNFSTGGESGSIGVRWTEARKKYLSEKLKGRVVSEETRRRLSESMKGKHPSEETRKKLSEQRRGNLNSFYGKQHTKESKEKMSDVHKGKTLTEKQLKCLELGRGIKYWTTETYDKLSKANQGEKSATAKLTEENVIDILHMLKNGCRYNEIKDKYDITDSEISRIKNKKRWAYLYDIFPELYDFQKLQPVTNIGVNNTSGFIGVNFDKRCNRWFSTIIVSGTYHCLGRFDSKEDAIKARLKGELQYLGDLSPQKHLFKEYGII